MIPLQQPNFSKEYGEWVVLTNTEKATGWTGLIFEEWRDECNKVVKEKCLHCKKSMVLLSHNYGYLSCMFDLSTSGTEQM